MKSVTLMAALFVAAVTPAQTVKLVGSGGYGSNSAYNRLYNRSRQITFTGRVVGKTIAPPIRGLGASVSLIVKSPNGGNSQVELGPQWFLSNQVAKIAVGDTVRVIGSKVRLGTNNNVVLARQIIDPRNRVLTLRDLKGNPYWSYTRSDYVAGDLPANSMSGTILRDQMTVIDGVTYGGYVLQTDNGNVNIVTAPDWYLARQDYAFSPGNYVTVIGDGRPTQVAPNTYFADTIYGNGVTVVLSDMGVPFYNNYGPTIIRR